MNNATYESIFGAPKVRRTWKHTLSAEKNAARIQQMQFCKKIRAAMQGYEVTFYFNPGGPAVWGETYLKISHNGKGVVEACLSVDYAYMRQWDSETNHSGRNHQISYTRKLDAPAFVMAAMELETPAVSEVLVVITLWAKRFSIARGWEWRRERLCSMDCVQDWLCMYRVDEPGVEFVASKRKPKMWEFGQ